MKACWAVLAMICALVAVGCGGSGGSGGDGSPPSQVTRQRVKSILGGSQMAMLQSGSQTSDQADAANGAPPPGQGPMMMLGSFMRGIGGMAMGGDGSGAPPEGDEDDPPPPWNPDFYFDEFLGLWVETQYSDTEWNMLLWVDEGKTESGGSFRTTFDTKDAYPLRYTSVYEITAGLFTGAAGGYEVVQQDENTGRMTYSNRWPGYGEDEGESTWSATSYLWRATSQMEDGSWYRHEGSFRNDGSGHSVSENSDGYKWSYRINADGTGSGLIEGPDPGLPAKVSWRDGKYRIVYADGTVEEWDMYGVADGHVGGGTGGSGGGSGGTDGPRPTSSRLRK